MFNSGDFVLYDHSGRLAAVVEIKNKLGTSGEWAAQTRRNILAHSRPYNADFFLLITPDPLYLWKGADPDPTQVVPPTFETDTRREFAPYFEGAKVDPRQVTGHAFELLVAAWLGDIIRPVSTTDSFPNSQSWLVESGFRTAIQDGRVEYETVA